MSAGVGAAILGCAGPRLSADEARLFADAGPFGFILFDRNLETPDQIRELTAAMRDAVGRDAPVFIDQEGGRVQRLRPPLARGWPPPLDHVAALGAGAARGMYLRARIIADELRGLGIDGNCVPTLDVARPDTHPVLRNRCLGTRAEIVARLGRAVLDGCLEGGVLPVIKHLPGHGLSRRDSHLETPVIAEERDVLEEVDFVPFRALSDAPLGMTAHLRFAALDPAPATIAPGMIRLIREDLGFGGLLMTDDISMQALSGPVADRAAAARAAGCDLVLHCNGDLAEMRALTDRAGHLDGPARARAVAALAARRAPPPVDIDALADELDRLSPERRA